MSKPTPRNVLVTTKYRYIGDTLLAVPTLRAIRRNWPDAKVTLLTGTLAADLMLNCPYVDEIIGFNPESPENRGIKLYTDLVLALRRRKIDTAFVYHSSFHAALTPWFAGVRYRMGWAGFEGRDLFLTRTLPYEEQRSELECNLDMLRDFDPQIVTDDQVELWLTPSELTNIPESIDIDGTLIGLQPGATNNGKRWPAQHFAKLADKLLSSGEADKIVLIGGPDEAVPTEEMIAECTDVVLAKTINLVGKTPLRQTLASLTRLAFFVGADTAIRQITVALKVPSIGLFGPTNVVKWGNQNPPLNQLIISETRKMADIDPDDVFDRLSSMRRQLNAENGTEIHLSAL